MTKFKFYDILNKKRKVRCLSLINRREEIKKKGFKIELANDRDTQNEMPFEAVDFSKIKVGVKTLEDAVLNLGSLRYVNRRLGDKRVVLKALAENDLPLLREISNFFYRTSGIYQSACDYIATMYRYDWYIVPEIYKDSVK